MATEQIRFRCAGAWVHADVIPHESEVQRRRSIGDVEMPSDIESLNVLLQVPLEGAVSEGIFTQRQRDKLRQLGPGLVHFTVDSGGVPTVRRVVAPPVSVPDVVIKGRNWKSALNQATRFAPYCRRSVILSSLPTDPELLLLEARFYGVGVGVSGGSGSSVSWHLEPAPFTPERFTGASWRFSELVFEAWLASQVPAEVS